MPAQGEQEVYITYSLIESGGTYSKKGQILEQTDSEITFKTLSEEYRIVEDTYLERKQACGWYRFGKITNIAIRERTEHSID